MTYTRRKKKSRARGNWTHGWGAKKKHRGAGHRGGRGNAGSGKRGDAKKPTYLTNGRQFGKHGFKSKSRSVEMIPVNLGYIEENLLTLIAKGKVEKKGDVYTIDIANLGANKLLAGGKITHKYDITADYASKNVVEKVEAAKGKVTVKNRPPIEALEEARAARIAKAAKDKVTPDKEKSEKTDATGAGKSKAKPAPADDDESDD